MKMSQYAASECAQSAQDQRDGRSSRSPTKSPSKSPKRRRDAANSCDGDQQEEEDVESGCTSKWKRPRNSTDSFDSAIAGITDWAEECIDNDTDDLRTDIFWAKTELDQDKNWSIVMDSKEWGDGNVKMRKVKWSFFIAVVGAGGIPKRSSYNDDELDGTDVDAYIFANALHRDGRSKRPQTVDCERRNSDGQKRGRL